MAELKTQRNNASVINFIHSVTEEQKRKDSETLLALFEKVTGEKASMWGESIIGFGSYHYKSERSTQEGDWPLTGFSPRKQNLTLYIMRDFEGSDELLDKLGKVKTSKGCIYVKKLDDIHLPLLEKLIVKSVQNMKSRYPTR